MPQLWGKTGVMGGYFMNLIGGDDVKGWHWALTPFVLIWIGFGLLILAFLFSQLVPQPRRPRPSEKKYRSLDKDGKLSEPQEMSCWVDASKRRYIEATEKGERFNINEWVEPAEVLITVVVPAYNEEKRLIGMLEETVNLLEREYSNQIAKPAHSNSNGDLRKRNTNASTPPKPTGWEILLVDDGSTDRTLSVAEHFTRTHLLPAHPRRASGPWTPRSNNGPTAANIPPDSIRMISLEQNRGKGGAVTHGMRHARGQYVLFADADGASDIQDLPKLVSAAQKIEPSDPLKLARAIAVGSRAHMVNSPSVVQRSKLRNFLMHAFHLILYCMTPPKTAQIKDTQCGFKLFSRPSLPYIVPYMHMEGWIFDVEMLMLAEFADIPVAEVPIGWKEVTGSKLNVMVDSLGMAWNLAMLRVCWGTGIYK